MIVDDYFAAIERGLRQNLLFGSLDEPVTCLASDDHNGLLRCRVFSGIAPTWTFTRLSALS